MFKKIRSIYKTRKFNVFLFFLLLALIYSMLSKLTSNYTKTIVFAVKAVENKKRMDIICENLYRIAASKGITYGSTAQVKEIISKKEPLLTGIGARNIVMNSSIHAKVY